MKKLLVMLIGAAVAIGASAIDTGVWFESLYQGWSTNDVDALNAATGDYWAENEPGTTNTYTIIGMGPYTGNYPSASEFTTNPDNALSVKTTFGKPVSFNVNDDGSQQVIGDDGVYFDSLVKFTVCEEPPSTNNYDGAKIVMWLQEQYDGEDITGTNLMVKAGFLMSDGNNGIAVSNAIYKCESVSPGFADEWHRITIKAIKSITKGGSEIPGFVIFKDAPSNADVSEAYVVESLSKDKWDIDVDLNESAHFFWDHKALFPSMIQSGGNKLKLTSASFDGTGDVNTLLFTTNAPKFAADYVAPKGSYRIGSGAETEFSTIKEVVDAINQYSGYPTDASVTFTKGFEFDAPVEFEYVVDGEYQPVITNLVIDFNGCIITNTSDYCAITNKIENFVIKDSIGTGGILCTKTGDDVGAFLQSGDSGYTTIEGGNFWGKISSEGLDGTLMISGGSFQQSDEELGEFVVKGKMLVAAGVNWYTIVDAFTVTFDPANGEEPETKNVATNTYATAPSEDPTWDGHTFQGWAPDPTETLIVSNTTFTAQWAEAVVPATVTVGKLNDHMSVAVVTNSVDAGTEAGDYFVNCGDSVEITYTADSGYNIGGAASYVTNFTVTGDVEIDAPTASATVFTITFEPGENASVDPVSTNYTIESGEITLPTATMNSGYVGPQFDGWTNETYTTKQTTFTPLAGNLGDFTFYAKWTAGGPTYPSYIDTSDATIRNQYIAWAEANNVTNGDGLEAYFLLNVAPGGLIPVFSSTEVAISGTTVTIDVSHGNVNGYPYYKAAATVAGLATAQPVAITITPADQVQGLDNGGRITLPGQSGEAAFYQIGISATPIPTSNP